MSASVKRYQDGDPAGVAEDDGYGGDDWPTEFMKDAARHGFDVENDPALRLRLWDLWKDARSLI